MKTLEEIKKAREEINTLISQAEVLTHEKATKIADEFGLHFTVGSETYHPAGHVPKWWISDFGWHHDKEYYESNGDWISSSDNC